MKPVQESLTDSDRELERAALGAMIANSKACYEALCLQLSVDHFASEKHQTIFRCVEKCYRQAGEVDVALLHSFLGETGAGEVTGWNEIFEMVEYVPTWYLIRSYVPRLDELRIRREKRLAIAEAAAAIARGNDDLADACLERAGQLRTRKKPKKTISHQMGELQQFLNGEAGAPLLTGWPSVDHSLKIMRGRLYAIAARPKEGKTTLAVQLGLGIARNGYRVHVFSGEMGQQDCNLLLLRIMSKVSLGHAAFVGMDSFRAGMVHSAAMERHQLAIEFDDTNRTLPEVMRQAKALRGKVDLFIVDHSSIISVPGLDKVRGVAAVSQACKQVLAVECGAACILLSQFNEARDEGGRKTLPGLANIFGGGALKQDCNAIAVLRRESYGGKQGEGASLLWELNRDAQYLGTTPLEYDTKLGIYLDPK